MEVPNIVREMHQMRQSGTTLQHIAEYIGVSRQWVSRQLIKYYGSTQIQDLVTIREFARMVGHTRRYINKLWHRGIIRPVQVIGRGRTLWGPESAVAAISYLDSLRCPICDTPLPSERQTYCSRGCYLETHKYKNMPEQARSRHRRSVAQWLTRHPEQARQIEQRKQRKYQAKKSTRRYHDT